MKPEDQFTKTVLDFLKRLPGIWKGIRSAPSNEPLTPLVIRVGVAGHLVLEDEATLRTTVIQFS
jgi:hypothetical protein